MGTLVARIERSAWRHETTVADLDEGDCVMSQSKLGQSKSGQSEPPSTRTASPSRLFLIGKNSRGNWVVQDQEGLCGGLFVDRAEALKFAMFENGNRPQAVIMVPGILELDMNAKPHASSHPTFNIRAALARAA
jgi:hypothetical protein